MSNIPAWGDESLPDDYGTSSAPAGVSDVDANEVHAIARELLDETHALLSRVGGTEAALEEVMTYLADVPAGGAWCWRYLDPYERVALFTELREWVDWMSDRYKVRQLIRPCWFKHAPVVEELTGLYVAWRSTFKEQPRAYNDEIVAFHDRWFWPLMRRIEERKFFNTCDGRQHKESEVAMPGTNMDDFTQILEAAMQDITPGEDADAVHAAIDNGEALALRDPKKDTTTPVLWRGSWWAILANSPDGLWVPRPAHVAEKLQALYDETHAKENA